LLLRADPAEGIVPLAVKWSVTNQTGHTIQQYELDANGGGVFGAPTASLSGIETSYASPGLFFPAVRVTDEQDTTYIATTVILAEAPATVVSRFQVLWSAFKARLQAGDVTGALSYVATTLRPRMETVFQQFGPALPTVAASLGQVEVTAQVGAMAEAIILQEEIEEPAALYFIYFRRDSLGRWLIEEM
jgi:hypothetical protein